MTEHGGYQPDQKSLRIVPDIIQHGSHIENQTPSPQESLKDRSSIILGDPKREIQQGVTDRVVAILVPGIVDPTSRLLRDEIPLIVVNDRHSENILVASQGDVTLYETGTDIRYGRTIPKAPSGQAFGTGFTIGRENKLSSPTNRIDLPKVDPFSKGRAATNASSKEQLTITPTQKDKITLRDGGRDNKSNSGSRVVYAMPVDTANGIQTKFSRREQLLQIPLDTRDLKIAIDGKNYSITPREDGSFLFASDNENNGVPITIRSNDPSNPNLAACFNLADRRTFASLSSIQREDGTFSQQIVIYRSEHAPGLKVRMDAPLTDNAMPERKVIHLDIQDPGPKIKKIAGGDFEHIFED